MGDIDPDLRACAFDFFYRFSRFEFALKENDFLKSDEEGKRAEPGWNDFISKYQTDYKLSEAGANLIKENPKCQIVVRERKLGFVQVNYENIPSELGKVVTLLKTVRNNLFHGGKHGAEGWDDPKRTLILLGLSIRILDELAALGNLEGDYKGIY